MILYYKPGSVMNTVTSSLKMEAACSSETVVRGSQPEECTAHQPRAVMRNRCAAEAIKVCHEIFTSHYNYNHNEINNYKNMNKYL
jgi:hypothetical protein